MSQLPNSNTSFGLTIAYLVPGFVSLFVVGQYFPTIHTWLVSAPSDAPSVGGFLYATVASYAIGLTISTVRWFVLDRLHHWTGIPRPAWDFSNLQQNVDAFQIAVDYHYRYYQFYGNTLMVLLVLVVFPHPLTGLMPGSALFHRVFLAAFAALFFAASRDALRNYHERTIAVQAMSRSQKERTDDERFKAPQAAGSGSEGAGSK